ncbi:MAG: phosphoadenosine phosphosulfate reductase family protein [FCB group bacterium]|nr:phosphoadenosine phosphosulfate reductase family protein [FCB group bacterium]
MEEKIKRAKELIESAITTYDNVAVACSFGKDSMVTLHLAREVDPEIEVFAVMTVYKPRVTYLYLRLMNSKWNLNTTVYIVADHIPEALRDDALNVVLLPVEEFASRSLQIKAQTGKEIYEADPDECCRLLKVDPTKLAVSKLDAWICGLRNTEGRTRKDYREIESKGGLVKINPILTFTEAEIWRYISTRGIDPHPWYGLGYRSLGCETCSHIGGELERDGRWINTSKCGGECGIHTQILK